MHTENRKDLIKLIQPRITATLCNTLVGSENIDRIMIMKNIESWKLSSGGVL
jgi:hypothetical protein